MNFLYPTKKDDKYRDYNKRKSNNKQRGRAPNYCCYCACYGYAYGYTVCAKNPYKIVEIAYCGCCKKFTRQPYKFTRWQRFILRWQGVKLQNTK